MAEYRAPGVYVEEVGSGVKAMEGVSTSIAGFVGLAEKGPTTGSPVLLTSFADYQRQFGGYLPESEYGAYRFLPNAVEQFFTNGGSCCYVMRVAPKDAKHAAVTSGKLSVTARSQGNWANNMQVILTPSVRARTQILAVPGGQDGCLYQVKNASAFQVGDVVCFRDSGTEKKEGVDTPVYGTVRSVNGNEVTLSQKLPDQSVDTNPIPKKVLELCGVDVVIRCGSQEEHFTGCSLTPGSPRYLLSALSKSRLVTVAPANNQALHGKAESLLTTLGAASGTAELRLTLQNGSDGGNSENGITVDAGVFIGQDNGPGQRTGIEAFREINDVSILAVPGVTDASVQAALISHCENLSNRFAVLDAPKDCTGVQALKQFRSAYDSSYAALYAPWVQVYDPLLVQPIYLPPSGSVCGIYARTDIERGVHKAPANEIVKGCTGLAAVYNDAEQGQLNPDGINLIRTIPKQGIRVWGARTCSSDGNWKYINVRRLFLFLEESIRANTGWVVFEPNDESLWSRVKDTISLFLETQRRNGALAGSTADQAYFVNVGPSTMTQDDILDGRLICEIGVAPVRPAEFVIFHITQITQSAT